MRKNGIAEYSFDNGTLKWTNGPRAVSYSIPNYADYPPFIQSALQNGFKQTIADAGALSDATIDQKFDAMQSRVDNLTKGIWTGPRESGNTLLFRAMVGLCNGKHKPFPKRTEAEVRVWLEAQSPKVKRQLAAKPAIRAAMDALRPEAVEIDVSELGL